MENIPFQPWIFIVPGVVVLAIAVYFGSRRHQDAEWNTDRRKKGRRTDERRDANERRGDTRLRHDQVHNPGRRRSEQRESKRRDPGSWKNVLASIKARVEEIQQDNRNS